MPLIYGSGRLPNSLPSKGFHQRHIPLCQYAQIPFQVSNENGNELSCGQSGFDLIQIIEGRYIGKEIGISWFTYCEEGIYEFLNLNFERLIERVLKIIYRACAYSILSISSYCWKDPLINGRIFLPLVRMILLIFFFLLLNP